MWNLPNTWNKAGKNGLNFQHLPQFIHIHTCFKDVFSTGKISFYMQKSMFLLVRNMLPLHEKNSFYSLKYVLPLVVNILPLLLEIVLTGRNMCFHYRALLVAKIFFRCKNMCFHWQEIYFHHWEKYVFQVNKCVSTIRKHVSTTEKSCIYWWKRFLTGERYVSTTRKNMCTNSCEICSTKQENILYR